MYINVRSRNEQTDNGMALTISLCTASFKVLQLKLTNAVPGFVFRRLSAFSQQKQQNQQNLTVAKAVFFYFELACDLRK